METTDHIVIWVPYQVHCLGNERPVINIMSFKEFTVVILNNEMAPETLVEECFVVFKVPANRAAVTSAAAVVFCQDIARLGQGEARIAQGTPEWAPRIVENRD